MADVDPLLAHAGSGDFEALKILLENSDSVGKRLKLRDADRRTDCFSLTARSHNVRVASKKPRRTALHRACAGGHEQITAHLLSKCANPNVEDEEDTCSRMQPQTRSVKPRGPEDWTPLHSAASRGSAQLCHLLVEACQSTC